VDAVYQPVQFAAARWIDCDSKKRLEEFERKHLASLARDSEVRLTYLAPNAWRLDFLMEEWPDIAFQKNRERD